MTQPPSPPSGAGARRSVVATVAKGTTVFALLLALPFACLLAQRRPIPEYTPDGARAFANEDAAARAIVSAVREGGAADVVERALAALGATARKRAWVTVHRPLNADTVRELDAADGAANVASLKLGEGDVVQVDVEIEPPWTGTWGGPFGYGVDVGLDGVVVAGAADGRVGAGRGTEVRLPGSFVERGDARKLYQAFYGPGAGDIDVIRTYALVEDSERRPRRLLLGALALADGTEGDAPVTPARLLEASVLGGEFLLEHLNDDGRFDYEIDASTAKLSPGYNVLRHAGTTYALLQLYHATGDRRFLDGADDALAWLFKIVEVDPRDTRRRYVNDAKKVKLGGSALALLAVVERLRAPNPPSTLRAIGDGLARHVLAQQLPSGAFDSYDAPTPEHVDDDRDSIYYPGEAILALARWDAVALDNDEHEWRAAARKGARYLVDERHRALGLRVRQPIDAWLALGIELLDRDEPDEHLAQYALEMAARVRRAQHEAGPSVPWPFRGARAEIGFGSLVSTGSRMELLAACAALEARHPALSWDSLPVRASAIANAAHGMRFQYTRDRLFLTTTRARALGGVPNSPIDPRVRIDGVQHNMSGWLALAALLDGRTLP